jgi:lipopolysaccharide/colanic/teichoic acid biosynthesis glycosyltransferase
MSIVGPRPFIPRESNVEGWAIRRFEVRPGITGLWQVSGRNDLTATTSCSSTTSMWRPGRCGGISRSCSRPL